MPLVELRNTEIQLGNVQAMRGVNLTIETGEIITVVGESGCGKSTLGRAVLGLLQPSSGQIFYHDQDIFENGYRMPDSLRLSVQVVHQDSYASLNPVRTIGEQLAAPLRRHKLVPKDQVKAKVSEILTEMGLTPADFFASKVPFQLSGGQRQRVSLARAAMLKPKLIVADEPVSGVDATLRLAILELMRRKNTEGIAFLYITHDLGTARYLARGGRMLVMYLGQVIESGPVETLLDDPLHPYLQALLAALPPLDPRKAKEAKPLPLRSLDMPDATNPPTGCSFHPRCPYAQARCQTEQPELRELRGQQVACHFAENLELSSCSGHEPTDRQKKR